MEDIRRLEDVADRLHGQIVANEGDELYDEEFDVGEGIDKLVSIEKQITERKKLEAEEPKAESKWDKFINFGKSWGTVIAGGLTLGGIIVHEIINRKNLSDVTEFEETGTFRSTGFRKWIK